MATQFRFLSALVAREDRGASMVEYALLLALIAVISILALTALGNTVSDQFDLINSNLGA